MKFTQKSDVGMICVVNFLEQPDLHVPERRRAACLGGILNVQAVAIDGIFCGKDNFNDKLFNVFVFDDNMIKQDGCGVDGETVVRCSVF